MPDGSLLARVPASSDPKRPSREFPPGRRDLAEAWLDAYLHPSAVEMTAAPLTLGEWAGTWWQAFVEPVRPSTSARRYLHSLRLLAPLYSTPLPDLRPSALQQLVGALSGRLGATTVAGAVGVWRRCLEAAVDDGHIARNPAQRLTLPRPAASPVRRHITPAEVAALWPRIAGHRFEAAYALLLGTGIRIGEVLGLAWADVDLAQRRAYIHRQWTDNRMRDELKGRNAHHIPLPPRVVAALIRHRDSQPPGAVLVMQSPYAGQRRNGSKRSDAPRPWAADVVRKDLLAVAESVNVPGFTPHAGRRGLASALLDGGASPAAIADRLGHSDPNVTLRHYTMPTDAGRDKADRLVDAYLGDGPDEAGSADQAG